MSLVITNAGIAASIVAGELGIQYKITHISIGSEGYVPTASQTELRNEILRKAITKGEQIGVGQLHFETVWDGQEEFEGKELGYWLEDGTLFAVDSRDGEVITYKRADTVVTEAVELNLSASSLTNITVELIGAPLATERVAGIAKIATREQVDEGSDDSAFLTIKKLLQRTSSISKLGVVQLSNLFNGSSQTKAVTEKALNDGLKTKANITSLQFGSYDPRRTYLYGEVCFTSDLETGAVYYWQWYSNVESLAGKGPLDEENRRPGWSDTSKPWYWSPYHSSRVGETVWWGGTELPEDVVLDNEQLLPIVVYHRLASARPDLVNGDFIQLKSASGRYLRAADGVNYITGQSHGDAMRNITGVVGVSSVGNHPFPSGVFHSVGSQQWGTGYSHQTEIVQMDASRQVPTANQNQPVTLIEWKGVAI